MTKLETFRALVLIKMRVDHEQTNCSLDMYFRLENMLRKLRREL